MRWKERILFFGLLSFPFATKANAQEAGEYPEYWQENVEKEIRNEVDWRYWGPWEFYINGGPWKVLDDIAINVKKVFLDSLIDPLPPDDLPGKELRRYYLVVDASFRALKGRKILYPSGDFWIKDENSRKMRTSDYEGNNVNGYPKLGTRVPMYEKLNPRKLKLVYPNVLPFDKIEIGAAREFGVSRKICFAIGENDVYGEGRRIKTYLDGNIWLSYGSESVPLTNVENFLREGYYKIKRQELNEKEIFSQAMNYILGTLVSEAPNVAVSYRQLNESSFRTIEKRDSGIDSITHYFKKITPFSSGFKIILLNYNHYYNESQIDSFLYFPKDREKPTVKIFDENGSILDLKEALETLK